MSTIMKESINFTDSSLSYEQKLDLAYSENTAPEILEALAAAEEQEGQGKSFELRGIVAQNLNCSSSLLEKLAKLKDDEVRVNVAGNPNCPLRLLKRWAKLKDNDIREAVSSNPSCPPELIVRLSQDIDSEVRSCAAGSDQCPIDVLARLENDPDWYVIMKVAGNPRTPLATLERLAAHDHCQVRAALARNPMCPLRILMQLSDDADSAVRNSVARSDQCPVELLVKLGSDVDQAVIIQVAENSRTPLETLERLAAHGDGKVRAALARNPMCPLRILMQLSDDADSAVRNSVVRSDQCPVELLVKLGSDVDRAVMIQVAGNSRTPLGTLERLAVHDDGEVRLAVAKNPMCSLDLKKIAVTIPECYFPSNDFLSALMEPVRELKNLIEEAKSEFPEHQLFHDPKYSNVFKDIDCCAPGWGLKLLRVPTQYADRTRSMLEGPFFTSIKHPWPDGGNTKYASPLVQIDLREISRLKGTDYGDGLLQLFAVANDLNIRVIPRVDVVIDQMTSSMPEHERELCGYFTQNYWLGYGCFVYQIIGYDNPVLSSHVDPPNDALGEDDPEIMKQIISRMESLSFHANGTHMFGTFSPIQYRNSEIGEVIMALDGDLCYSWGDMGNAQIYVGRRQNEPALYFFAEWSCY